MLNSTKSKVSKKMKFSLMILLSFSMIFSYGCLSKTSQQKSYAAGNPDSNFSPATLQFLRDNTGLDGEQWNNIMMLVNKPEQDDLNWINFYGYCEDIDDDRGYTIGIFGATTGGSNDTGPDGPDLFKAYDAAKGASNPSVKGAFTRSVLRVR